ncbi:MAG: hypothetical protein DRN88_05920 [Candidatus Hydrothermarchaeota archaeon]|nr:MAG: hypothetical protein DRN88_05920 [Candidatus Hydrothermarchaeota archaeon]
MEVVIKMEYIVRVDKQGRLVLPIELRKDLKLEKGGKIIIKRKNTRIYIETKTEFEDKAKEWKKKIKEIKVIPRKLEVKETKWVSENWIKKKLCITE